MHSYAFTSIKPSPKTNVPLENLCNIFIRQCARPEFLKWSASVKKNLNKEFAMGSKAFLASTFIFLILRKITKIINKAQLHFTYTQARYIFSDFFPSKYSWNTSISNHCYIVYILHFINSSYYLATENMAIQSSVCLSKAFPVADFWRPRGLQQNWNRVLKTTKRKKASYLNEDWHFFLCFLHKCATEYCNGVSNLPEL